MADVVSKETRSRMMAGIRGANTAPELALRREMHARGFRFRLHVAGLPGRPDLVFPKYRAAVLVHGCFWHRHAECRFTTTPASNAAFWSAKFEGNVARDLRNLEKLRSVGWRTAIVWECEVRDGAGHAAAQLAKWLRSKQRHIEIPIKPRHIGNAD
jgi:DNA mismatch endonuclease (patch repair protein)